MNQLLLNIAYTVYEYRDEEDSKFYGPKYKDVLTNLMKLGNEIYLIELSSYG
ncbi:hypothetical protein [Enterococcus sp. AZ140]|uniref:hypothetical protein n=1 Tax=Enterococcus sp. AZ140 TaxID=2774731 RepID=UPI003F686E69